ncbi:MAG: hypothetical protein ACK4N5_13985 [Myxococcales bacterium]
MSEGPVLTLKTPQEFFKDLLNGAVQNQKVPLGEMTEFYLVDLLSRFMDAEALFSRNSEGQLEQEPLALILARALEGTREQRVSALRKLGDNSLYVAGFFGDSLSRKVVDVDYYITMGGTAYGALARLTRESPSGGAFVSLYDELCQKFTAIVDLLAEISERVAVSSNQGVIRLYERWVKTGSDRLSRLLAEQGVIPTFIKPGQVQ